ncbi:hypothetical protein BKA70DRAFT_1103106, partial [Coprinopsis sp. MPI-PUGE-AT-0042]
DADIVFVSSDQPTPVPFHIHSKNLEVSTGALPLLVGPLKHETVPLSEPAEVLEVLFAFQYPRRHPDFKENIMFALLDQDSEAAEKYEVYAAMTVCKIRMKEALHEHPVELCRYATQHGYKDLL